MYLIKQKKEKLKIARGFTLIEMMVAISIFIIITMVVMFNFSGFNGSLIVTNAAYDVAMAVREAQVYGMSVKGSGSSSSFSRAYGIHFETGANSGKFIIFNDTNGDSLYSAGEGIETYNFVSNYNISSLQFSSNGTDYSSAGSLDISFKRPEPEARIFAGNINTSAYSSARICMKSPSNQKKAVYVNSSGQISVKAGTVCP